MVGKLAEGAVGEGAMREGAVGEGAAGEGAVGEVAAMGAEVRPASVLGEGGDSLVLVVKDVEDQQGGIVEGDLSSPPQSAIGLYLLAER